MTDCTLFVPRALTNDLALRNKYTLVDHFLLGIFSGAGIDEEGQLYTGGTGGTDEESESEEDEEEEDDEVNFDEVTEVRFPTEIGPLGDRRLCKIRCIKGKWVGPLCATNDEGKFYLCYLSTTFLLFVLYCVHR